MIAMISFLCGLPAGIMHINAEKMKAMEICGLPAGIMHINAEKMKAMEIYGLTVEYMPSPIAVDVENPRFGWEMRSLRYLCASSIT